MFYFKIYHTCKRISIMYMYILRNNSKIHICVPKQLKRKIYNNKFRDPLSSLTMSSPCLPNPKCACHSLAFHYSFTTYLFTSLKKLCKLLINSLWHIFLTCFICHIFLGSPILLNWGTVIDFERCSVPHNGQFFLHCLVLEGFLYPPQDTLN